MNFRELQTPEVQLPRTHLLRLSEKGVLGSGSLL
jgi:hypothetical protein